MMFIKATREHTVRVLYQSVVILYRKKLASCVFVVVVVISNVTY